MLRLQKYALTKLFGLFFLSFFCVCVSFSLAQAEIKDISAEEALAIAEAADSQYIVLDVRMPFEFENGHVENAVHIDYKNENFAAEVAKLDKSKTYVIYCRTGVRAEGAVNVMKEQGFENLHNVTGGYHAMFPDKTYDMPK